METIRLNNGVVMPLLGFGVYQIPERQTCKNAVLGAIKAGYRLIDTAQAYQNEDAVGDAIVLSGVPREDFFITTKLWVQDVSYEGAKRAFAASLRKLGTDYLDLYLIHQPFGDVHGAWRAMEELYEQGKIRAIGVSNFQPDRLMDLITFNKVVPAINQVETHPFYQQHEAHAFMTEQGVQIESWGPFAEGKNNIFTNEILTLIAAKHRKTVAQVILRSLVQQGVVVIPKTVHYDRMVENINVFDFQLDDLDMERIKTLDTNSSLFINHRDPAIVKWIAGWKV